jgi:hypothetical protein
MYLNPDVNTELPLQRRDTFLVGCIEDGQAFDLLTILAAIEACITHRCGRG